MINIIIILLSLTTQSVGFSQNSTLINQEEISFASGYFGTRSKILIDTEHYIELKTYDKLLFMLESTQIAEQFVGSIICRKLAEDYKMPLTQSQVNRIKSIENSEQTLVFKSGCTCFMEVSIKDYFAGENACGLKRHMDTWIVELKNKYAR